MGNSPSGAADQQIKLILAQYDILQEIPTQNITYLQHRETGKQYLLRQMTFNDKKQFQKSFEFLKKKKLELQGCQHICPLVKYMTKSQDQFCSTFYKIYALFEYPQRTLDDEINQRNLQKRKFQEKELWSILASCILGLSHLQKQGIKHTSLRSGNILLSHKGVIKIADPSTTACLPNYDVLLNKRTTPHIYLSPQQAQSLKQQLISPQYNPYKTDIWALGMIMLEAGLLQYQDQCYRDQGSRIHWQTLNYNINRFGQIYSQQLKSMIQLMLSRQQTVRPQWLDLQEHVMKVDEEVRGSYINGNQRQQPQHRQQQPQHRQQHRQQQINKPPPRLTAPYARTHNYSDQKLQQQPHIVSKVISTIQTKKMGTPVQIYKQVQHNPVIIHHYPPPNIIVQGSRTQQQYQNHHSSHSSQNNFIPVQVSNIQHSRPSRNIFPADSYIEHTKTDQNLIVVEDQQDQTESDQFFQKQQTRQNYDQLTGKFGMYHNAKYSSAVKYPQNHNYLRTVDHRGSGPVKFNNGTASNKGLNTSIAPSSPMRGNQSSVNDAKPQFKVQIFKMGSKYQGYKLNGMRHGHGKFYYQDGGMYDGEWNCNRMEGHGKLYYQSGSLAYQGQWVKDQFTGYGILYNQTPDPLNHPFNYQNFDDIDQYWTRYQGNFYEDNKHGKGILYLSNGQYFEGQFNTDVIHGYGMFHTMTGKQIQGNWDNNHLLTK